eukprot:2334488-Rhodomonas_salina.1
MALCVFASCFSSSFLLPALSSSPHLLIASSPHILISSLPRLLILIASSHLASRRTGGSAEQHRRRRRRSPRAALARNPERSLPYLDISSPVILDISSPIILDISSAMIGLEISTPQSSNPCLPFMFSLAFKLSAVVFPLCHIASCAFSSVFSLCLVLFSLRQSPEDSAATAIESMEAKREAEAGAQEPLVAHGPVSQNEFLHGLGIRDRIMMLLEHPNADEEVVEEEKAVVVEEEDYAARVHAGVAVAHALMLLLVASHLARRVRAHVTRRATADLTGHGCDALAWMGQQST